MDLDKSADIGHQMGGQEKAADALLFLYGAVHSLNSVRSDLIFVRTNFLKAFQF
jgi:hypothetical protein